MTPQLALGIFITLLGVLLTLDRLDIVDATFSFRWWPLVLIVIGLSMLTRRAERRARLWGYGWLVIGSWLLLRTLGIVRVGFWELLFPLLLVAIGVHLIRQTLHRGQYSFGSRTGRASLFAVLGESKRTVNDAPFRGGYMMALMGGCQIDLRQAIIPPGDEATLDLAAIMGGLEVWVPSGWNVVSQVVPILGGVEDKRLLPATVPPLVPGDAPPRLLVRGTVVMGGLTIKN